MAMWCEEPTHWKRHWCFLREGGERNDRGGDGWMASSTQTHEFGQTPADSEGQESLACCSSLGFKESDRTEWLNNNNILQYKMKC